VMKFVSMMSHGHIAIQGDSAGCGNGQVIFGIIQLGPIKARIALPGIVWSRQISTHVEFLWDAGSARFYLAFHQIFLMPQLGSVRRFVA